MEDSGSSDLGSNPRGTTTASLMKEFDSLMPDRCAWRRSNSTLTEVVELVLTQNVFWTRRKSSMKKSASVAQGESMQNFVFGQMEVRQYLKFSSIMNGLVGLRNYRNTKGQVNWIGDWGSVNALTFLSSLVFFGK